MQLLKGLLVQLPRMPSMFASAGRPIRVPQPLLQRRRLVMAADRPLVGGQLPLLGQQVPLLGLSVCPPGRLARSNSVPNPGEGSLDPTIGLLDLGPDPLDRLTGLLDQPIARRNMVPDPLDQAPTGACCLRARIAVHRGLHHRPGRGSINLIDNAGFIPFG